MSQQEIYRNRQPRGRGYRDSGRNGGQGFGPKPSGYRNDQREPQAFNDDTPLLPLTPRRGLGAACTYD